MTILPSLSRRYRRIRETILRSTIRWGRRRGQPDLVNHSVSTRV
jgi:hypothetical protein